MSEITKAVERFLEARERVADAKKELDRTNAIADAARRACDNLLPEGKYIFRRYGGYGTPYVVEFTDEWKLFSVLELLDPKEPEPIAPDAPPLHREVNEVTAMAHMNKAIDLISDASNRPETVIYTEREHPDDERDGASPS